MFSPAMKLPFVKKLDNSSKYEIDDIYVLYFDGCSKGNPGPGGAGAVLYKNDEEIWSDCVFVGNRVTNNLAEYTGLILGLNHTANQPHIKRLFVKGDSQLVVKQMRGEYKVNSSNLIELHKNAKLLASVFEKIEYEHVYRQNNKRADALSNDGLLKNVK
jgi:ribonuclease HI